MSSDSEDSEETLHDIDEIKFRSPQISAVLADDVQSLQLLVESGESMNIYDNGYTPLHIAVLKDKAQVFNYLLTLDEVKIDAENSNRFTPLRFALIHHKEQFALKLIEKGADVNLVDPTGNTPLHYAVKAHSVKVGCILIEKGAEIDVQNCHKETPLYTACYYDNCDIICMLLYYGADVNIPNDQGMLPFGLLLGNPHEYLQEILFNYTFDQDEIPVHLSMLTSAMEMRSPWFMKIVEKTSEVLYEESDLEEISQQLFSIDVEIFLVFLQKFRDVAEDIFTLCFSMDDYLRILKTEVEDESKFVNSFYMLCESSVIYCVAEQYKPKMRLVDAIIDPDMSEDTLTKMICCFLSWGGDVTSHDLDTVYRHYGYCELFKTMLHMDFVCCKREGPMYCRARKFWMSTVIYDVRVNTDICLTEPKKYITYSDFDKLLRFFALPKLNLERLKGVRVVTMPCLMELARNAARKYIIQRYNVRKCNHFYTVLKWLPISQVYKAILSFEKELYKP